MHLHDQHDETDGPTVSAQIRLDTGGRSPRAAHHVDHG
jgi:hypothetical protein